MNILNMPEVVDIGIEKEKRRRDFYKKVSEAFKEKEISKLFKDLSKWEEEHIEKFSSIRKSLKESETTSSVPGELESYIGTLLEEKLYTEVEPKQFADNIKKPIDAIRRGIEFEKDAILFFGEIAQYMDADSKAIIDTLVAEEKQHIVYLAEMKRKI